MAFRARDGLLLLGPWLRVSNISIMPVTPDCGREADLRQVMTGLMIYELVNNYQQTGSVIATRPSFNFMVSPLRGWLAGRC